MNKERKYKNVSVDKLVPYINNTKTHSKEQIKKIQSSIREFGFVNPILIDGAYNIIAGHGRLEGAKAEGLKEVPCLFIEDLTDTQIKAYRIADNRIAEDAEWNMELLTIEMEDLEDLFTGFDAEEFDEIMGIDKEVVEDDFEVELPDETKSKLGDIYQLGKHRLMCGDSTSESYVNLLMDGNKADMVFTDPPYGMFLDADYSDMKLGFKNTTGGKKYENVIGDNNDFIPELITTIFDNFSYCKEVFIWGFDYFAELILNRNNGSVFVWDKRGNDNDDTANDESSDKMFGSTFELCWSKVRHKRLMARIKWAGIFGLPKEFDKKRHHPTQKPIELSSWFISRYSEEKSNIVDLYGGSGSTLIACEQLDRICYMMELDPKYIDVIINRWEQFTGGKAVLLNE